MVMLWIVALCVTLDNGFPRSAKARCRRRPHFFLCALFRFPTALRRCSSPSPFSWSFWCCAGAACSQRSLSRRRSRSAAAQLPSSALRSLSSLPEFDPVSQVLGAFGKDATLTGRTVLWNYATEEIARHPLLGVGHGGFWTPEDGLSVASRIYNEFHKVPYANFFFPQLLLRNRRTSGLDRPWHRRHRHPLVPVADQSCRAALEQHARDLFCLHRAHHPCAKLYRSRTDGDVLAIIHAVYDGRPSYPGKEGRGPDIAPRASHASRHSVKIE